MNAVRNLEVKDPPSNDRRYQDLISLQQKLVHIQRRADSHIRKLAKDKQDLELRLQQALKQIETLKTENEVLLRDNQTMKREKEEAEQAKEPKRITKKRPQAPKGKGILKDLNSPPTQRRKTVHFSEETEKEISRAETIKRLRNRIIGTQERANSLRKADTAMPKKKQKTKSASSKSLSSLELAKSNEDRPKRKQQTNEDEIPCLDETETSHIDEPTHLNSSNVNAVKSTFMAASSLMVAAAFLRRHKA